MQQLVSSIAALETKDRQSVLEKMETTQCGKCEHWSENWDYSIRRRERGSTVTYDRA